MIGIQVGEELTFDPTGIRVRVAADNRIEYEDKLYTLSGFCCDFLPEKMHVASDAYQGGPLLFFLQRRNPRPSSDGEGKESGRLKNEGSQTVTNCNRLKLRAEDGKMRLTDVATAG